MREVLVKTFERDHVGITKEVWKPGFFHGFFTAINDEGIKDIIGLIESAEKGTVHKIQLGSFKFITHPDK